MVARVSGREGGEAVGNWLDDNLSRECKNQIARSWAENTGTSGVFTYYDLKSPMWAEALQWAIEGSAIGAFCAIDRP